MKGVEGLESFKMLPQDREAYRKWKEGAAEKGCTPMEVAEQYERMGMNEYAAQLREVIQIMEAIQ